MEINAIKLKQYAELFRNAIENARNEKLIINDSRFCSFPLNCCKDTCYLLGNYLVHQGIVCKKITGVNNSINPRGNGQSHAWLEVGDLVVDITGDQFKNNEDYLNFSERVYVGGINEFYKLFEKQNIEDIIPLDMIQNNTREQLMRLYQVISKHL